MTPQRSHKPPRIDDGGHWREQALCREVGVEFFPVPGDSNAARQAKAVCKLCPVTVECLQYALDNHEWSGIWGGTTERQRHKINQQRRRAAGARDYWLLDKENH